MNSNNSKIIIMAFCSYFLVSSSSSIMRRRASITTTIQRSFLTTKTGTGIVSVEAFVPSIYIGQQHRHRQHYKSSAVGSSFSTSSSSSSSLKSTSTASASSSTDEETTTKLDNDSNDSNNSKSNSNSNDNNSNNSFDLPFLNLHTITQNELEVLIVSWGYPKFRSKQIYEWIRSKGITNPNEMVNIPKTLRTTLIQFTTTPTPTTNDEDSDNEDSESETYDNFGGGSLQLEYEAISKDGTRKRAYRLRDGQLIESVLMGPYNDGRYTACISSQAGCAMGCIFCATGQMGFARQLTSNEIFEQVSRFSTELKKESIQNQNPHTRLSNIVFMGMGEPLANYNNVVTSVNRINNELGIGARKITVSTVGVVPNIRKLFADNTLMPQVRLAVSLHCSNDLERSKLLPANDRYGGLHELMTCLKDYIDTTGRRVTLEWALIANQNDNIATAKELGHLIQKYQLRRDMVHVNVIPLNPTDGFVNGQPSNVKAVNAFCHCLSNEFHITATPRVRRGIDIDAGCGQLKAKITSKKKPKGIIVNVNVEKEVVEPTEPEPLELSDFVVDDLQQELQRIVGVYEDDDDDDDIVTAATAAATSDISNDGNAGEGDEEQFFNDIRSFDIAAAAATATAATTSEAATAGPSINANANRENGKKEIVEFIIDTNAVDFEQDDFDNPEYEIGSNDMDEVHRLMSLVDNIVPKQQQQPVTTADTADTNTEVEEVEEYESILKGPTTTIVNEDAVRVAKKKRKKLLRNIKQIQNLKKMKENGELKEYSKEQIEKINKEDIWRIEIESLEHNLK